MTAPTPLPRMSPESQGIPSAAIAAFVRTCEQNIQYLHSFMLLRHGAVVAEGWWYPWRPDAPHMLFSLSKSFTSTAVGLAIAEGRLTLDDPVLQFFPVAAPKKVSPHLAAMHVRHLLSMSTGHDQDTTERVMDARDPVKKFLALEVEHAPGTHFAYNSAATFMLAAIVQQLTGQTLVEYLTPRLFEPLGIENAAWESHRNGVNYGGWGLSIKTEDIARFGQLYLQKGWWEGRQLIPAEWVAAATAFQVSNAANQTPDWRQGYGYQFWRCQHNCYRGDGAFGQFCIVMPDQDAVLAITAGVPDMQAVLDAAWQTLLPAMGPVALPPDQVAADSEGDCLRLSTTDAQTARNDLRIDPPQGMAGAPTPAGLLGATGAPTPANLPAETGSPSLASFSTKTYTFAPNYQTLHSLRFDFGEQGGELTYRLLAGGARRGTHHLQFGYANWVDGTSFLGDVIPRRVAASGVWTDAHTFALTLCAYETPFIATLTFRFEGEQVLYDFKVNVAFGPLERPRLVGMCAL